MEIFDEQRCSGCIFVVGGMGVCEYSVHELIRVCMYVYGQDI